MSLDRFQIFGSIGYGLVGNSRMVLQFGPRYRKPVDNTLTVSIYQATTGGEVSVLMDDEHVDALAGWLENGCYEFEHQGPMSKLTAWDDWDDYHRENVVHIRIALNGSGRSREVALTERHARQVLTWIREQAQTYIWEGWLKPEDVRPTYHGHLKVDGERVGSCRLCELKGSRA